MNLLSIAHTPILVTPDATVTQAVEASLAARVGAVAVLEGGSLCGIFTERDMMYKVVAARLDPDTTPVGQVMTTPVHTIAPDTRPDEVLELMLARHIRHLPVSRDGKAVEGMLSIRNILQYLVGHLRRDLGYLEAYITDSPTGSTSSH